MMTNIIIFLNQIRDYFKTNPLILFFVGSFVLLIFLVSLSLLFEPKKDSTSQTIAVPTVAVYPSGARQTKIIPTVVPTKQKDSETSKEVEQTEDGFEKHWEYSPFEEGDLKNFKHTKSYRSDGAVIYSFPSENPNRPNIMIVRENVTIENRVVQFDTTVNNVMNFLGKPDYVAVGSKFWGKDASMYIYFDRGLAYTADKNKKIVEQMEFKPVLPKDFKKTYGDDLIGELQKQ